MKITNTDKFRSNLREWMELAKTNPIKITRKNGESFVLINSEKFQKMQINLARLEGLSTSLADVLNGDVHEATEKSLTETFKAAKAKALKKFKEKEQVPSAHT